MYVRHVLLKNICGLRSLDLDLTDGELANRSTLLIGKNGAGKSSVLRAIVLGLASDAEATALLAEPFGSPFISVGQDKGTIKLELVNREGRSVCRTVDVVRKDGQNDERVESKSESEPYQQGLLVVAFGAGRSNEGGELLRRYTLVDSTYMLFNYEGTFIQPELTLRRLKDYVGDNEYDGVTNRIKFALGLDESHQLEFQRGGGVVVSGPYKESAIPLESWADGYRVTLNWLLDIYAWAMRCEGSIDEEGNVHGILLADEIEQHLHPSMQRKIIQSLKDLFPKMQILMSTHSPSILQGTEPSEVISLLRRDDSEVTAIRSPDYSGSSVEDLLTSAELFQTEAYSTRVERIRAEYASLIAKDQLSDPEQRRLKVLGRELSGLRIISPRKHEDETLTRLETLLSGLVDDSG